MIKLIVYLTVFVISPSWAEGFLSREQMKDDFKKGFLMTCLPTIEAQLDRVGVLDRVSQEARILYCTCVGIEIFDDFTLNEISEFERTTELPVRKQKVRQQLSGKCANKIFR